MHMLLFIRFQFSMMLVCIECGLPVQSLYRAFNKEDIRLTSCANCHQVADKYIEWELQVVLIDLILQRPQAYRHILFNRSLSHRRTREVIKFLTVIMAFDAFDRWYLNAEPMKWPSAERVVESPVNVFTQWLLPHENQWTILATSIGETSVYIFSIFLFVRVYMNKEWGRGQYNAKTLLSAIVLSCFSKLGVLLYMVFDASGPHRLGIALLTFLSNMASIGVFIGKKNHASNPLLPVIVICTAQIARLLFACAVSRIEPSIHFSFI
jgi:lipid intermediate transporter